MVQVRERPTVLEQHDEVARRLLREAFDGTELLPPMEHRPITPGTPDTTRRHPVRWLRWMGVVAILVVAIGAGFVFTGDDASKPDATAPTLVRDIRTADGWERHLTAVSMGTLDFRTADGWERVLATTAPVMNDQRTADGWERYFTQLADMRADLMQ